MKEKEVSFEIVYQSGISAVNSGRPYLCVIFIYEIV